MKAEHRIENKIRLVLLVGGILSGAGCAITADAHETVHRIISAQRVVSAVNVRAGLADLPTGTKWEGLSVDLTKALAAAVLGDASKVSFVSADRKSGLEKLGKGEVNLYLPVEATAPSRLAALGLMASQPFFFNVQRVMVTKPSGVTAVDQLRDKSIAVQPGYVNEQNVEMANEEHLRNYFRRAGWQVLVFPFQEWDEMESAFVSEKVKAISAEETELARLRAANQEEVGDAVILPQVINVEPVTAVVGSGDLSWLALLNETISLLIEAEYLGISSDNVDAMTSSPDPEIRYLLGVTPGIGSPVGLDDRWAGRVLKAVGNYGQAFKRDLGADSPLAIPRGLNHLWSHGGLLCPGPIR